MPADFCRCADMNELIQQLYLRQTRRSFLGAAARGIGSIALASMVDPRTLLGAHATPATQPGQPPYSGVVHPLHSAPKAKRVIPLYRAGGPSHLETLDYKPKLAAMTGQ